MADLGDDVKVRKIAEPIEAPNFTPIAPPERIEVGKPTRERELVPVRSR